MPTTFPEFALEFISLDNDTFARSQERKSCSPPTFTQSMKPTSTTPLIQYSSTPGDDPMEIDKSGAGKAARKANRRANNLCICCGKSGDVVATIGGW